MDTERYLHLWPADVILMAVRWYLSHPLSATSVMVLLAERDIDISPRTVLRWLRPVSARCWCHCRVGSVRFHCRNDQ